MNNPTLRRTISCLILIICFTPYQAICQYLDFEVEDHFEIHRDPDVGIKLMPENYCENTESDDVGVVLKRRKVVINTNLPIPTPGTCGGYYSDKVIEFYPETFAGSPNVSSYLGLPANPWGRVYAGFVSATSYSNAYGGQFSNHLILPGRNLLAEDDGIADDGMIFGPGGVGDTGDIGMWADDDIVMNFRAGNNQQNGVFKVTENSPTQVRFEVGTGGTVFMPALPISTTPYPSVVINPVDGQLYYSSTTLDKTFQESQSNLLDDIARLKISNIELMNQLVEVKKLLELQAKELSLFKKQITNTLENE